MIAGRVVFMTPSHFCLQLALRSTERISHLIKTFFFFFKPRKPDLLYLIAKANHKWEDWFSLLVRRASTHALGGEKTAKTCMPSSWMTSSQGRSKHGIIWLKLKRWFGIGGTHSGSQTRLCRGKIVVPPGLGCLTFSTGLNPFEV